MCITSLRFGDNLQISMDKKKWLDPHVSTIEERVGVGWGRFLGAGTTNL